MWSWLEKLIRYLKGEEAEQPQRSVRLPAGTAPGQLKAKTKSIYPRERREQQMESVGRRERKRQFRFPVIPDEPPRQKVQEQQEKPFTPVPPKAYGSYDEKQKPVYKPSEVISPIYGKIDPVRQTAERAPFRHQQELYSASEEVQTPFRDEPAMPGELPVGTLMEVPTGEPATTLVDKQPTETEPTWDEPMATESSTFVEPAAVEEMSAEIEDAESASVAETAETVEAEPDPIVETAETADTEPDPIVETAVTVEAEPEAASEEAESFPAATEQDEADVSDLHLTSVVEQPESQLNHPVIPIQQPVWQTPVEERGMAATAGSDYERPSLSLLNPSPLPDGDDNEYTMEQKRLLEETLANFNVSAQVVGIVKGPSVTRFELQPAPGVKVNKITSLTDDIKLNLAAKDIRIEAPIPGRNAVGVEVPNVKSEPVFISRIIGSEKFQSHPSPLAVALGMDIGGEPIVADIKKMPHGLIAGATGSGKSVCINSIIVSLLFKASPEQVRLLLIDPKMVELAPYNHLPHLVTPVVTEAKQATAALKWAVEEMERRYALFVDAGARDIERYNLTTDEPLPYIVIVIDELADLMMVAPQDVEDCIIRIAQKARACGIHLLLATQRPSVDVITGNIKANVPTRLAFAVFSQVDSRTILDQSGAERLLGRGDMLFLESGAAPVRLQGNFVSDDEIERVTQMIKKQRKPEYFFSKEDLEQQVQSYDMGDDPLYGEALLFVAEQGQASASGLQRRFRIGYNRAARLIEMMEAEGHVAGQSGGKPRAVLITLEDARALAEGSTLL